MNPAQLLKHFDRISNSPDAVPLLRQFILDLAVRGKLVEQDANDEPASELIKRIHVEKARLVKDGKTRAQEPALPTDNEEESFQVPSGWCWSRLATLSRKIHYGFTASANKLIRDVRLLRITDIQNNSVDWDAVPGCEISAVEVDQYELGAGDILIARTGGTVGKTFLVKHVPVTAVFASYLIRVQGSRELYDQYLKLFLESPVYWKQLEDGTRGGAQPNVNGQTLGNMTVTVPPLAEQHRIVAKVNELMALCDRLEAAQAEREGRRNRVAAASLHRLNQPTAADDPQAFRKHATFHLQHLPRLTTRPEHIKQLRQTILNLAVRGQLVSQNPNDEPAGELLRRIASEKARLEARGAIKKSKPLPPLGVGDTPFALPLRWEWCRLRLLAYSLGDGLHGTPTYVDGTKYYFINGNNLVDGRIVIKSNTKTVSFDELQKHKKLLSSNTVLVSINGTLGSIAFYDNEQVVLGKSACYFNLSENIDKRYIRLVIESPYFIDYALRNATGTTIMNLSLKAMNEFPVPVPPEAEQHRIVAKVDELMALCDQLEAQLTTAQRESRRLLESVLHQALNDNPALNDSLQHHSPYPAFSAPLRGA